MKKSLIFTSICFGALLVGIGGYNYITSKKLTPISQTKQIINLTDELINQTSNPIDGTFIHDITMAELDKLYQGVTSDKIPHVFVEKIPDDFQVKSTNDQTLFMKLMMPHLLLANEKVMRERKVLLILDEKNKKNEPFTDLENSFLERMIKKYDAEHLKSKTAQIADLILKIDIIPPSVGLSLAIWATNWGQKEKQSPFYEYAWDENTQYTPIKFQKLSEATESFVLQLNSRSQLIELRQIRHHFRMYKKNPNSGKNLTNGMRNYAPSIPSFSDQLKLIYSLGYIQEMDEACFKEGCNLTK